MPIVPSPQAHLAVAPGIIDVIVSDASFPFSDPMNQLLGFPVVAPLAPGAPATPAPAVIATRWNATFFAFATKTAMLDPPAIVASAALNAKSSNVTPCVNPVTCSAYPLGGATVVFCAAL
jgi:hypothetical protein